jgi:hypothetical protein
MGLEVMIAAVVVHETYHCRCARHIDANNAEHLESQMTIVDVGTRGGT